MNLLSTILTAIPFALAISIAPGAAFFGIIQTSLTKGFKSGMRFAIGISLSDLTLIALCLWGLASIMQNEKARLIASFIGGSILIIYGLSNFFNKKSKLNEKHQQEVLRSESSSSIFTQYAKGFIFNFTNPFVWLLWIGITPYSGAEINLQMLFFLTIVATVFSIDCMKSFFAGKIKNAITPNVAHLINRIVGIVFCGLGIFMIIKMLLTIY